MTTSPEDAINTKNLEHAINKLEAVLDVEGASRRSSSHRA